MKSKAITPERMKQKTILICVPAYLDMDAGFVQSLIHLQYPCSCSIQFIKNTLIAEARNSFTRTAIEGNFDYVMFLDSDMVFPEDTITKLFLDNYDIVSGIYFKRVPPFSPLVFKTLDLYETGLKFEAIDDDYPRDKVFECAGVGAGCLLIKTSVLKKLTDVYGAPFHTLPGIGEDFSFCLRAKEQGYKIYCDSSVKCGHIAKLVVREENRNILNSINNPQF